MLCMSRPSPQAPLPSDGSWLSWHTRVFPAWLVLLLLGVPVVPAAHADEPRVLRSFELPDQFGQRHAVTFPRERPVLLLVGDRKGSEEVDGWIEPLKSRWGQVADIVGVADVDGVPRLFRGRLADSIRKSRPKPVMLDFDGTITKALACRGKTANVFVLDRTGRVLASVTGVAGEPGFGMLRDALERVRLPQPAPASPP